MENIQVGDIMTREPITINPDTNLLECAKKYWLVREILLSARTDQIPKEFMGGYEKTKEKLVSSV